mmetsp:Transcript_22452/g.19945  ORF Transcript_22452/g.19945 Transcript_22452/m.19945 type:complete len:135 (+) Transcript_22452:26-430(+)
MYYPNLNKDLTSITQELKENSDFTNFLSGELEKKDFLGFYNEPYQHDLSSFQTDELCSINANVESIFSCNLKEETNEPIFDKDQKEIFDKWLDSFYLPFSAQETVSQTSTEVRIPSLFHSDKNCTSVRKLETSK